jgi:hypothetical protein
MLQALILATSLFDGQSLTGWYPQGAVDWRVEDGAIVAAGVGDGFLLSEAEFHNFELSLEFWVDAGTNSGVFIRCSDRERIHPDSCYELNIWDEHPRQEARTGAIVFRFMPPMVHVNTVGRWNTLHVSAQRDKIELRVNNQVTAELDDAESRAGFVALQHWEEGTVKFRNIVIEPLED